MSTDATWDIALTKAPNGRIVISIPAALSGAMNERGLSRATLSVTDDGLLVVPYVAAPREGRNKQRVELPESWL